MEWVASTLTLPRNVIYPALLTLMGTPRLPAVDWTDASADLNGLVRFGERRNLVSAHVPSHFRRTIPSCKEQTKGLVFVKNTETQSSRENFPNNTWLYINEEMTYKKVISYTKTRELYSFGIFFVAQNIGIIKWRKWNTPSSRRNENWCKDDKNVLTLRECIMCDKRVDSKFYLHQLMHFFIQTCISLLSYIKNT